jgi:3-phenylpropionate/trans-cinnamate dioxygenase ferredoxin subunit
MKVKVCRASEVPSGGMVGVDVPGRRVLIANVQDRLFAVDDTCTHAEASLSEGHVEADECTVECPLHNAVFDLKTGQVLEAPAEEDLASYPVSVEDGDVYVEIEGA